jgi:hypothetical protein
VNATTKSRARRIIGGARQLWAELDYAQRRLLEIRTGIPNLTRDRRDHRAGVHAQWDRRLSPHGR